MSEDLYYIDFFLKDFGFDENSSRIKHPVVTFFHLIFKSLALIGNKFKLIFNIFFHIVLL